MTEFQPTDEQNTNLDIVAGDMDRAGLDHYFVDGAVQLARTDQRIHDLMSLWHEVANPAMGDELPEPELTRMRAEIVQDIQESLTAQRQADMQDRVVSDSRELLLELQTTESGKAIAGIFGLAKD